MHLRTLLREELARRQQRNRRYSLRAFARDLELHHATLSRVIRGRQRLTAVPVEVLAARLRIAAPVVLASTLADADTAVLQTLQRRRFRPDSRWIATQTGLRLDDVNASLLRLLRRGALRMVSAREWTVING